MNLWEKNAGAPLWIVYNKSCQMLWLAPNIVINSPNTIDDGSNQ